MPTYQYRARLLQVSNRGNTRQPRDARTIAVGCIAVYATLFATGYLLYGHIELGVLCSAIAISSAYALQRTIRSAPLA